HLADLYVLLFFFSSRRRHTRSKRDWSSDVCSSDLSHSMRVSTSASSVTPAASAFEAICSGREAPTSAVETLSLASTQATASWAKIGRASCRDREQMAGGTRTLEKKERDE